jgi:hypothetical protein
MQKNRFVIRTLDASGKWEEKLDVDRDGKTNIRGNTTIVEPGKCLLAQERIGFEPLTGMLNEPKPWQIYRVAFDENGRKIRQLRFEIAHPGKKDDPKLYQAVLGVNEGGKFIPYLTIRADGTVIVRLKEKDGKPPDVKGRIIEAPIKPDLDDPRFVEKMQSDWAKAILNNSLTLLGDLQIINFKPQIRLIIGEPFSFTFQVSNPSRGDIPLVVSDVQMTVSNNQKSVKVPCVIKPLNFPLSAGAIQTVQATSDPIPDLDPSTHPPFPVTIEITVFGFGTLGRPITDNLTVELAAHHQGINIG